MRCQRFEGMSPVVISFYVYKYIYIYIYIYNIYKYYIYIIYRQIDRQTDIQIYRYIDIYLKPFNDVFDKQKIVLKAQLK